MEDRHDRGYVSRRVLRRSSTNRGRSPGLEVSHEEASSEK